MDLNVIPNCLKIKNPKTRDIQLDYLRDGHGKLHYEISRDVEF